MRIQEIPLGNFHTVAGVFGVKPIIQGSDASLRRGRRSIELVQREGGNFRVVAVADDKPQLLSFATINGLKVTDYTSLRRQQQHGYLDPLPTGHSTEPKVHEIPMEMM